jgi:hypothetical protein
MRRNPLSPTPPRPKGVIHRLGSSWEEKLRTLFGDLGPEFDDIHRGVFLTEYPVVAYAYAADRSLSGENDFGVEDVIDPPVLIGFNLQEEEYIDTDAMVTAQNLLEVAWNWELDEVDDEDLGDVFSEYSRSQYFDTMHEPRAVVAAGGDIGNRPDARAFFEAAKELQEALRRRDDDAEDIYELSPEYRTLALKLAGEIVPQSRVLTEISGDQVACILVVHPMTWNEEMGSALVDPEDELESGPLTDMIPALNRFILRHAVDVYPSGIRPSTVKQWHGTSLSVARAAYPELISREQYHAAVKEGSTYSAFDWQSFEEMEEEED